MALNTELNIYFKAIDEDSIGFGKRKILHAANLSKVFANGTDALQNDAIYTSGVEISASSNTFFNVQSLSRYLYDGSSTSIDMEEVTCIIIENTGDIDLKVNDSAGSDRLSTIFLASKDEIVLKAGGLFLWSSPYDGATAITTADRIYIKNEDITESATCNIYIIGRTA